ncbi:sensor histidine kinase [Marinactinospora rubrisoli]|uniref:histidine kinase n=1 Tax=Marinactinospora rubrisoli TaxID=2715399 RepID=A0ABW2KHX0_9ACTN
MSTFTPITPGQAVRQRRFLISAWPWRSLGYLLSAWAVTGLVAAPLAMLCLPWIVLLVHIVERASYQPGVVGLMLASGTLMLAGGGPLLALPVAALERLRLRMVDSAPLLSGHRTPDAPGLWAWLRTRYTEGATWRDLGYLLLLVLLVAPLTVLLIAGVGLFLLLLACSPFLLVGDSGPVSLGFGEVDTPVEAVPFALAALVLLLGGFPYAVALLAEGNRVLARQLLGGSRPEELRAELVEVTRSRARLVDAFEAERRRIERDLHDGAQQRLVALTMQLGLARLDLPDGPPAAAVAAAQDQAKQLMAELRELIRGIRPQILTDRGLAAALPELADRTGLPVTVRADLPRRPPEHVEGTAYFVVAEALTNVAKHSGATGTVVTADLHGDLLVVEVADNGRGGADPDRGSGLIGLADRVAVTGGRMLLSSPAGGPTLLRVELPCDESRPAAPPAPEEPTTGPAGPGVPCE